jgi:hypothetical protein
MSESLGGLMSAFRNAMHTTARTILAEEIAAGTALVDWQGNSQDYANDIVFVGAVKATRTPITTNRGVEVELELILEVESFRAGGAESDPLAFDAAADIVDRIGEYVRRAAPDGDTTLGGVVRACQLAELESEFVDVVADSGKGRMWGATGIFTAQARLRG